MPKYLPGLAFDRERESVFDEDPVTGAYDKVLLTGTLRLSSRTPSPNCLHPVRTEANEGTMHSRWLSSPCLVSRLLRRRSLAFALSGAMRRNRHYSRRGRGLCR